MGLSLQAKKFINSEHVGDFVSIELPGFPDKSGESATEEVRIHYVEAGVGEPMIFVHGIGQSLFTWRASFNELSRRYRVIAIDLPGHGYSGRPVQFDYTIAEQSDVIHMFMDALGLESAHLVAFSTGALYALDFMSKYPERVGKAVLMTPGGITPEMPLSIRMLGSSFLGSLASRLYNRRVVEKMLSECFFDLTNIDNDTIDGYYSTVADTYSRKALKLSVSNLDDQSVEGILRTIENEVLILWGSEDKWHLASANEIYHAALTKAQFGIIRNAGHFLHEEKPTRFIEAVLEYIPAPIENGAGA